MSFLHRFAFPLVLLAASVLVLTNLTTLEIQPSDEGYYALRAKAIVDYGCWLDQTEYAIGGFYSSSHPPLLIWLMAATAKAVGLNAFSLRVWSAIAFVLCVWCVYDITKSTTGDQAASILAALAAAFSPMMLWYGRMAQFDMLVTMLSAAQIMFYLRYLSTNRPLYLWTCGLALGLALLSKTLVGGFAGATIIVHGAYMLTSGRIALKDFVAHYSIVLGVGLVVGFSWFAAVCVLHEGFFERYVHFFVVERFTMNQTHSKHFTGALYYANVAITRIPLVGVLLVWVVAFMSDRAFRNPARVLLMLWFAVPFVVLSAASTKLLWYALLFFPPLFVMIGESLAIVMKVYFMHTESLAEPMDKPHSYMLHRRSVLFSLVLMGLLAVWSATQLWHRPLMNAVRERVLMRSPQELWHAAIILGALAAASFGVWLLHRFVPKRVPMLLVGSIIAFGLALSLNTVFNELPAAPQVLKGITEMRSAFDRERPSLLVFVTDYTPQPQGDNTQFSYYFSGIDVNAERWGHTTRFVQCSADSASRLLPRLLESLATTSTVMVISQKSALQTDGKTSLYSPAFIDKFALTASSLGLQPKASTEHYIAYSLTAQAQRPPQTPHE
jgi:4-amino-4-deoxy-L-arabinose transferase-like glycosyltransferase